MQIKKKNKKNLWSDVKTDDQILKFIKRDVRGRMENSSQLDNTILNKILNANWGLR